MSPSSHPAGISKHVRTGNRTQKVAPEDAMEYIAQRWLTKP
jgi:hypothetical protein